VTHYKHPFLEHRKNMNGVAFLDLNCSIRINSLTDGTIICARQTHTEGYLDAVLYDYSRAFAGDPGPVMNNT
jgi:hypothetical protein